MNSKYFATSGATAPREAPEEGLQHLFPVSHTAATMGPRETWSPKGRLTSWGDIQTDRSHEAMMSRYLQFGEECAARNLVPSYRLFEHWMVSDVIAEASRSAKQPAKASRD